MQDYKGVIAVLNDLIKINGDRITGYEKAAGNLENTEVMIKSLFYQISDESQEIKGRLEEKVISLGGIPINDLTVPGKIYHRWIDDKGPFTGSNTPALLESIEFAEDAAQIAYKDAIEESKNFPEDVRLMIKNQQHLLKIAHDLIRIQRNQNHEVSS